MSYATKNFKTSKLRKNEDKYLQNRYAKRSKSPHVFAVLESQFLTLRQRPALIIVLAHDVTDRPWVYIRKMCKPGIW